MDKKRCLAEINRSVKVIAKALAVTFFLLPLRYYTYMVVIFLVN